MRRHHIGQLFRGFMMRHRQVMVGRRKVLRLLASHRVPVHEKAQVRFGQALSEPVVLVDQRGNDGLNRLQMLQHDGAMFLSGLGIESDRRAHIREVNGRRITPLRSDTMVHTASDRYDRRQGQDPGASIQPHSHGPIRRWEATTSLIPSCPDLVNR